MSKVMTDDEAVRFVQQQLKNAGFDPGVIDGAFGASSQMAFADLINRAHAGAADANLPPIEVRPLDAPDPPLCWGAKVSSTFRRRVYWMSGELGLPIETGADDLMACMAWESNNTFSPSVANMAGSGATGLIQFMPTTAIGLGTTTAALAKMTAEDQLNYVFKYFRPYKGKLRNLGDIYMAILWPAGVGQPDSFVLWEKGKRPTTYRQNAGLDVNKDGAITRGEAIAKVNARRADGFRLGNFWKGA